MGGEGGVERKEERRLSGRSKRERGRKESRGKERGGEEKGKRECRIVFWNVAGLNNKDRDFWRELGEWDVKILLKT